MASIVVNFLLITLVCSLYSSSDTTLIWLKHIVVDLTRAFEAFTANMSIGGSAEAYYANVNTHLNITKNAAYCSATLLADALLVNTSWFETVTSRWLTACRSTEHLSSGDVIIWSLFFRSYFSFLILVHFYTIIPALFFFSDQFGSHVGLVHMVCQRGTPWQQRASLYRVCSIEILLRCNVGS